MGRTIITEEDVRKAREKAEERSREVIAQNTITYSSAPKDEEEERARRERERRVLEEARRVEEEELTRAAALSQTVDNYTDRLLKYIPAESVALYLTLQGIVLSSVESPALNAWLWFAFGIGIVGTPLYLWRVQQVSLL